MKNKAIKINKKKIIFIIMFILIGIAIVSRYIYINNKYPSPIVEEHKLNEEVEYNGVKITAKEFKLVKDEELRKMDLKNVNMYEEDEEKMNAGVVTLNIKNDSNEIKKIETYAFVLSTINWRNGLNLEMFQNFNDNDTKLYLELKPGEEVTNKYVYTMITDQFTEKCWNNIDDEKFKLVLNLYPVNKSINLN